MAKLITPEAIKAGLPFVIAGLKWAASRTDNTVDDNAVLQVEKALSNPMILAFLLSLIAGDVPPPANLTEDEKAAAETIIENRELIQAFLGVAA